MDINFCYIEGISYIDTPYFASQAEQEDYFEEKVMCTIGTSFYPPHYKNRIIIDTDDINFYSNVNYCYFEFRDKIYYYFIDSVEYISENTIAIKITMDVIQSFFFNIYVQDAIIEREHINRWVKSGQNWYMNRNYIRENVSKNEFEVETSTKYNGRDDDKLFLAIKVYDATDGTIINRQKHNSRIYINDTTFIDVPYGIFILPLGIDRIAYKDSGGSTSYDINYEEIVKLLTDNYVLDFYVLKRNPYNSKVRYFTSGGKKVMEFTSDAIPNATVYKQFIMAEPDFSVIQGTDTLYTTIIPYRKDDVSTISVICNRITSINNVLANVAYNEPGVIDENYYRITFGDIDIVASYPLHLALSVSFTAQVVTDFDNNADVYYISDGINNTSLENNRYSTAVSSNNKFNIQMLNDAYKTYAANNANRWLVTGLQATKNFANIFIGIMLGGAVGGAMGALTSGVATSNAHNKGLGPLTSQALEDYNYLLAPATTRNTGNAVSDLIGLRQYLYSKTYKVRDIIQCAMYYQRNGYKVDRFVTLKAHIFNEVNHRYYYNILKLKDANLHLHNVIEDEETISLIKERLENGVRAWNVIVGNIEYTIGSYLYDNVEKDFIS